MTVKDIGPKPNAFDIEKATEENSNYRDVAWSGKYLQVTLMSIEPGKSIGLEKHPETDQFIRLEAGTGRATIGPEKDNLTFIEDVSDGWSVMVPAGMWHDVINTGDEPMRLYTVYAPVHHAADIVQETAEDAERDEESGKDEPPAWSVQPKHSEPDETA